jgi:thioredoxin 1
MVERLLLSLVIALLAVVVLVALRHLNQRRASHALADTAGDQRPGILYFRSDHCAPCRVQSHHLRQLQRDMGGHLAIQEIDAERESDLAARFGVVTLPTTLVMDGRGRVKHINYGLAASATLARQLEKVL